MIFVVWPKDLHDLDLDSDLFQRGHVLPPLNSWGVILTSVIRRTSTDRRVPIDATPDSCCLMPRRSPWSTALWRYTPTGSRHQWNGTTIPPIAQVAMANTLVWCVHHADVQCCQYISLSHTSRLARNMAKEAISPSGKLPMFPWIIVRLSVYYRGVNLSYGFSLFWLAYGRTRQSLRI